MSEPQVPGYDAVELLGYGSGGEVWLARDRTTGTPVALKRLPVGADLAARDRLRREAAVLAGVEHPHVVRLLGVHGDGDALVLVLELAPGGSLARLIATRRRLTPGEVVTVAVPLAQALAAVHTLGLAHGDVTPGNVLFAADGRPLLSDLGVARLLGSPAREVGGTRGYLDPAVAAGGPAGPAADVHGLAATCLSALTGRAPYDEHGQRVPVPDAGHPALVAALERALAADPADRPTAQQLAVAVYDAAGAEPVRLEHTAGPVGAAPVTDPHVAVATHQVDPHRRPPVPEPAPQVRRAWRWPAALDAVRSRGRMVAGSVLGGIAVLLAAALGIAWAGADDDSTAAVTARRQPTPPAAASTAAPPPEGSGWGATLAALDADRSRAFAAGDAGRLATVYAPGAPALRRDRELLSELAGAGLRAADLRLTVTDVSVLSRGPHRVTLTVTDVMPAYRLVDDDGDLVEERPGRDAETWTVELARADGDWRVYDVTRG
jgi:hypothetical protein